MLTLSVYAYSVRYVLGCANRIIGIKNGLSTRFSNVLVTSLVDWNSGLTKRQIQINSSSINNIVDLNFANATSVNSKLDFLQEVADSSDGTYRVWSYNTTSCCSNHQTTMFIIYLNTYLLTPSTSTSYIRGVISHELGHALGLADFNNNYLYKDHIMNYANKYTLYYVPSDKEISAVDSYWNH